MAGIDDALSDIHSVAGDVPTQGAGQNASQGSQGGAGGGSGGSPVDAALGDLSARQQASQATGTQGPPPSPEEQYYRQEEQRGLFGTGAGWDTWLGGAAAGLGRAQDEIVRGVAMGGLPYLAGARGALNAAVGGQDIGQGYAQARDAERQAQASYHAQHPVMATALDVLGSFVGMRPGASTLAAPAPAAAPTTVGRVVQAAKPLAAGAGLGAASGAMSTAGDWSDKAWGAGIGALIGSAGAAAVPLASAGISALRSAGRNMLSSATSYVDRQIIGALAKNNNMTPQQAANTYAQWQAAGMKPDTLMELGGKPLQDLARGIHSQGGEGATYLTNILTAREANAPARVMGDFSNTMSTAPSQDVYAIAQGLRTARSVGADPFYKRAFAANTNMQHPALEGILETPALKVAQQEAMVRMKNDLYADPTIAPTLQMPRSLRYLDYTKQALDGMIGWGKTPGLLESKGVGPVGGLKRLQKDFVNILDEADATRSTVALGDYARARSIYSGPSQSLNALNDGLEFLKQAPEETRADLARLAPNDQEHYRTGAIRAISDKIDKSGGLTAVRNTFSPTGPQGLRKQISALYDNPADVDRLQGLLEREANMKATQNHVTGGSQSIPRAHDLDDQGGIGADVLHTGFDMLTGKNKAVAATEFFMRNAKNAGRYMSGLTPARASALARRLGETREGPNTAYLSRLANPPPPARPPWWQPLGGPSSPAVTGGKPLGMAAGASTGQIAGQLVKGITGYQDGGGVKPITPPPPPPPVPPVEDRADAIERMLDQGKYVGKKLGFGGRTGFDSGGAADDIPLGGEPNYGGPPPDAPKPTLQQMPYQVPQGLPAARYERAQAYAPVKQELQHQADPLWAIQSGLANAPFPQEPKDWRHPTDQEMSAIGNFAMGFGGAGMTGAESEALGGLGGAAEHAGTEAAAAPAEGGFSGRGGVSGGAGELAAPGGEGFGPSRLAPDEPLRGLPTQVRIPRQNRTITAGPDPRIRQVAADYMAKTGLPDNPPQEYLRVDPQRGARVAQAFAEMKHDPGDPLVKASYQALADETMAQWRAIKKTGLKVQFWRGDDPYEASPRLATEDVRNNNHMWVYPTDAGFGTTPPTPEQIASDPMLTMTKEKFNGEPARINDIFRVVHDYFGHAKEGVGFRADGAENAWNSHARMYSPLARIAMTAETRGQNSWLNWGPHGDVNRTAPIAGTTFADQKQGVMPDWVYHEGAPGLTPLNIADMRRFVQGAPTIKRMDPSERASAADANAYRLGLPMRSEIEGAREDAEGAVANAPNTGLFDFSNLSQRPNVPQYDLPRYQPQHGVSQRLQDLMENPDVREQMLQGIGRGVREGGPGWYNAEQLRQEFHRELGPEAGEQGFRRFMQHVSGTSPRSNVMDNIRNASFQHFLEMRGEHPNDINPNPFPYGHVAQNLHRSNATKIRGPGYNLFENPKPPSFYENLTGNWRPGTMDAHAIKAPAIMSRDPRWLANQFREPIGVDLQGNEQFRNIYPKRMYESGELTMDQAVNDPQMWTGRPNDNEYAALENWYRGLGREYELDTAPTQASGWIGNRDITKLGTQPLPFMDLFDRVLNRTAYARGENPRETLRHFIRGTKPLLEQGGRVGFGGGGEGFGATHP